jgi:hypothetical protein
VAAIATGRPFLGVAVAVLGLVGGVGLLAVTRSSEPDVTVTGIEKRFWPIHLFPRREGTIVYDATESLPRSTFELELLEDRDAVGQARQQLVGSGELPVVMSREGNVEERNREVLERVRTAVANAESRRVEAPVVEADSPLVGTLDALSAYVDEGDGAAATVDVPLGTAHDEITAIEEFEQLATTDDSEDDMLAFQAEGTDSVEAISDAQENAIELLNDHVGTAGDVFALSTYHFYCPSCLADDIETELDLQHDGGMRWYCPTCREHVEKERVVPKHRVRGEVVEDVWDQLWIEKDDERRRTYERIEDRKADLKEREFELRREEIRSVGDRIKDIRSKIRDLETQATAGRGAIDEIGSLMVKYEHLHRERKQEFQNDVENAIDRIDARTKEILEETRDIQQQKLEEAEQEAEQKAEMLKADEIQREREQIAVQQAFAQQRHDESSAQRETLSDQIAVFNDRMDEALAAQG